MLLNKYSHLLLGLMVIPKMFGHNQSLERSFITKSLALHSHNASRYTKNRLFLDLVHFLCTS